MPETPPPAATPDFWPGVDPEHWAQAPPSVSNWAESDSESFIDLTSDAEDDAGPASMPPLSAVGSNPDELYMRLTLCEPTSLALLPSVLLPAGKEFLVRVDKTAKMIEIDPVTIALNNLAFGGNILVSPSEWNSLKHQKTDMVLPIGVSSIKESAFFGWDIRSIIIPEGVTTIEPTAFFGCSKLSSVTFPKTIRSIGFKAFGNCPLLRKVTIPLADGVKEDAFEDAFDASTMVWLERPFTEMPFVGPVV